MENFDQKWVEYENLYVKELMVIEKEARKFITDAIGMEEELTLLENKFSYEEYIVHKEQEGINSLKIKLV